MHITRNRLVIGVLVAVGAVASIALGTQSHAATESDCSSNSIIPCGITSAKDFRAKYNNGTSPTVHDRTSKNGKKMHVSHAELQAVYAHFGWTSSIINNSTMVSGYAYKNGDVKVDGKVVATNAQSAGRWKTNMSGVPGHAFKAGGKTYYKNSTQKRFTATKHAAYVMFGADGKFIGAIEVACANPIPATPKPKPTYSCDNLQAIAVKSANKDVMKYKFVSKASAKNGAKIKNYSYTFGDGLKTTTGSTTSHTYKKAGTYKVVVKANVTVPHASNRSVTSKACQATVKPHKNVVKPAVVKCDSLTLRKISDTTYNLKATASATPGVPFKQKAGVINGYTYTVKDSNGKVVKTVNKKTGEKTSESGNFSLNPGNYTAQVVVHSNVGNKTSKACTVKICVPAPNKIKVCRLSDYTIVTINEKDFDSSKYSKNLSDCEKVKVCDTTTNTIVEVTKKEAKDSRYTTNFDECAEVKVCDTTTNQIVTVTKEEAKDSKYTTDLSQCKPVEVCDTTTSKIVKVYPSQIDNERYTTDLSKCAPTPPVVPPTTPPELPHTGTSDVLASLVGAGSLIAALTYYIASRRALGM